MVARAGLDADDVVYEIGPGKGIITRELARTGARVVAVEIDPLLCAALEEEFGSRPGVETHNQDFLTFAIDREDYKVVSSIPYNITAELVRTLFLRARPPVRAVLIMQREAAMRFTGERGESVLSLRIKARVSLEIVRPVDGTAFRPVPAVDSVVLAAARRGEPRIAPERARLFRRFARHGFGHGRTNLKQNFKNLFTYTQWRRLSRDLGFATNAPPSELDAEQWFGLFDFFLRARSAAQVRVPAPWQV
jgi:23S rRNA (adenine-N6)-dimethyltransferase